MTALEWWNANWVWIVFCLVLILALLLRKLFNKPKKELVVEEYNYPKDFSDALFPEQGFSILVGLNDQMKATDKEIENTKKEAKKLATDLKALDQYYLTQKKKLNMKRKSLELNYNTYGARQDMIVKMIQNQKELDAAKEAYKKVR